MANRTMFTRKSIKMKHIPLLTVAGLSSALAASRAIAGIPGDLPGPGIFALLALGVVGAIGISRLRK
jgi:hypothetical protein